ncbi:Biopolymer transport protein ExbD/TolR [Rubripirellula obstinata]|uniref:Biopolymer transport protein ExbD/TolR n=1 Tax=Rubripirellula obstinata TaxID=406547 RepID=A0A5B1CKA8_9BACT|nr:biopolymer transporter ExbD [Rubripirellula obstinata]KAA1260752.1 Biopolymer transport protein ExbD/TolR [Rubripirellula obstinata]
MKIPGGNTDRSIELKMTPMIDVVFLLLVFFVWTSSFELPEYDLPGAIATPPGGSIDSSAQPAETFDEIIIRISNRDSMTSINMNGTVLADVDALTDRLAQVVAIGVQPPVIVDPDDNVTMDVAVSVYDAARSAGVDRVLFAASE